MSDAERSHHRAVTADDGRVARRGRRRRPPLRRVVAAVGLGMVLTLPGWGIAPLAHSAEAPVLHDDDYRTPVDTDLFVAAPGPTANDVGLDETQHVKVVGGPPIGIVRMRSDGDFVFEPGHGFVGQARFTYCATANGTDCDSNVATVRIAVVPPVVVHDDAYQAVENTTLTVAAPGFLGNDTGQPPVTVVIINEPRHGMVNHGTDGAFTYTPEPGFTGIDAFPYRARDFGGESGIATVTIDVSAPTPHVNDDSYTTPHDTTLQPATGVLANDTAPIGAAAHTVAAPQHATHFTLHADGTFIYVPSPHFTGTDSFTYCLAIQPVELTTEAPAECAGNVATVTITVTADPTIPTANPPTPSTTTTATAPTGSGPITMAAATPIAAAQATLPTAGRTVAASASLPATGSDAGRYAAFGLLLIAAGSMVLLASGRRRRTGSDA